MVQHIYECKGFVDEPFQNDHMHDLLTLAEITLIYIKFVNVETIQINFPLPFKLIKYCY